MAKTNTPPATLSTAQIAQAAGGNTALRQILQATATAVNAQAEQTNSTNKGAPNQSRATVTYSNPDFIVTFVDPGGIPSMTTAQAAQQAASTGLGANPVLALIFHQVQAATSVRFDAASNVVSYGGDSGSAQTTFTCTGLASNHQWYFRARTSFDGVHWNAWKNLNGGKPTNANPQGVILSGVPSGLFATFTLPGHQTFGFGVTHPRSGNLSGTAGGVLIENCFGIAAPATYDENNNHTDSITCTIDSLGVPTLTYVDGSGHSWSGSVNMLLAGWGVSGQGIRSFKLGDGGEWAVVTVSGGEQLAFGQGSTVSGGSFALPAGFTADGTLAVCSVGAANSEGNAAHGINTCSVAAGSTLVNSSYADGSGNRWGAESAPWFALAFSPGLAVNLVQVPGGRWVIVPTPSGRIAFGVGTTASGGVLPLPPGGYGYPQCLAWGTLSSFNDTGNDMHGVNQCTIDTGTAGAGGGVTGTYRDGENHIWTGNVSWFAMAWS